MIVVIFLIDKVSSCLADSLPGESVYYGDMEFHSICPHDELGFYDWLREQDGNNGIVGVRLGLHEPEMFQSTKVSFKSTHSSYSIENGYFTIVWDDTKNVDKLKSCDQAFGGCTAYQSSSGEYALTFDLYGLDKKEQASLVEQVGC